MDNSEKQKQRNTIQPPVIIHIYTRAQAIEDGVLVRVEDGINGIETVFTSNLYGEGYDDENKRKELIRKGIELLRKHDEEDTDSMKLRVIERDKIWLIQDGDGLCFLKPEDY